MSPSFIQPSLGPRDVHAAWQRLRFVLRPTPLHFCGRRDAALKLENLQETGAYKVRGAFNAVAMQIARGDRRPLVAASAGNHALGVAWAARYFGLRASVVVPRGAPRTKVDGARALGACVLELDGDFEACRAHAERLAQREGWRSVHAFDDPEVIAGQGTVAVELASYAPDVVIVPIGGGGLAAGVALWLRELGVRVVGAQVVGVDAMYRVLRGEPTRAPARTVADGLAVSTPGRLTAAICGAALERVVRVTEREVKETMLELAERDELVVEGAGAVAVAALRHVPGKRRVAIVSGGNVDVATIADIKASALRRRQRAARRDGAAF